MKKGLIILGVVAVLAIGGYMLYNKREESESGSPEDAGNGGEGSGSENGTNTATNRLKDGKLSVDISDEKIPQWQTASTQARDRIRLAASSKYSEAKKAAMQDAINSIMWTDSKQWRIDLWSMAAKEGKSLSQKIEESAEWVATSKGIR